MWLGFKGYRCESGIPLQKKLRSPKDFYLKPVRPFFMIFESSINAKLFRVVYRAGNFQNPESSHPSFIQPPLPVKKKFKPSPVQISVYAP